ncbi:MAG: type II secretion system protein [Opitutaceae bacterium]|nr:type II secretion system protein [Opitutaceae bacterium]
MIARPPVARAARTRAFTLIELMVVVGIIIVLLGGIGLAVAGRGGEGVALSNAQSTVASLVGAARAQAALHQTRSRLLVYATLPTSSGDWTKYLRTLQVVREDTLPNGTTAWVAAGQPVTLPAPICVVPRSPVPTNHLNPGVTWNNNAATGPVSTLTQLAGFSYRGQADPRAPTQFFGEQGRSGTVLFIEFSADGTVTPNPTKIALATAVVAANAIPRFNNASGVRGLHVRRSGAISLVNDATGF